MVGGDEDTALERLGETLTPILNPWGLPEWAKLRGEDLYAVTSVQSAVAAEFSAICIENPVASNSLIVVDDVQVSAAGVNIPATLEIMLISAVSATYTVVARPASLRDRRFRSTFASKAQLRFGSDPSNTFGAQLAQIPVTTLENAYRCLPVILQPGDLLAVIGQTVNSALRVNWVWRERAALPGELV